MVDNFRRCRGALHTLDAVARKLRDLATLANLQRGEINERYKEER